MIAADGSASDGDVTRLLKQQGFSKKPRKGENVSAIDALLTAIQHTRDVDYSGPLAGYKAGLHEIGTKRVS